MSKMTSLPGRSISGNRKVSTMNLQDSSFSQGDKLTEMWLKCEAQRQMHRLAHKHFDHLEFWLNSFPLIVVTAVSGIIAFLSSSDILDPSQKEFLSLTVGALSIISVAWQQIGKICNYGTRAEMHKNAALGMKKITDSITFNQIDPDLGPPAIDGLDEEPAPGAPTTSSDENIPLEPHKTPEEGGNLAATYRDLYGQCLESCNSAIPIYINQAFLLADSRLTMILNRRTFMKQARKDIQGTRTMKFRQLVFGTTYNEVFCAITSAWCWPFAIANPNKAVSVALKNVKLTYDQSETFLKGVESGYLSDGLLSFDMNSTNKDQN